MRQTLLGIDGVTLKGVPSLNLRGQRSVNLIESAIDEIIATEGGLVFTNRPNDRGGPTFAGITFKTFKAWRVSRGEPEPAVEDLKTIQETEVREIYNQKYIRAPGFDKIDDTLLRRNVIDAGVLHGQGWAARCIQEIIGVKADGLIGTISLKAINGREGTPVNLRFIARRIEKVVRIAKTDPTQLANLLGWTNRALRFLLEEAEFTEDETRR